MKLNDPFGRMARRREREYESLKQALLKAGMTDEQKARDLMDNLAKRSKTGLMVIVPIVAVLALLFREYAVFILAFGALIILWLTNTSRRGQEYISRYIEEECQNTAHSEPDSEAETDPTQPKALEQEQERDETGTDSERPPKA